MDKENRVYEMCELRIEGSHEGEPDSLVDAYALIQCGDNTVTVKGFYDGKGEYIGFRFLPEQSGLHYYTVFRKGKNVLSGTVSISEAKSGKHGPVRAEGTHLVYADGMLAPMFGTTVYALAHQSEDILEETFKSLSNGAFNKVRMCLFPKHYEYNKNEPAHLAFLRDEQAENIEFNDTLGLPRSVKPFDTDRPDYDFWNDFETIIKRLDDMGIQVDLILFHPYDRWGHSHMGREKNLRYLDYAIRRLAAFPNIWWSLANEYDLFFDWNIDMWHEIDEFIGDNDPYHHMLSNHNCFAMYDYSRKNVTHASVQARAMHLVSPLQKRFGKPVLYDEVCYEGNLKETWGSISAKEMVNRFWKATVTGGFCTHGEVILDDDIVTREQQDNAVLWWAKGGKLKGESPARIRFLRELVESLPGSIDPYDLGLNNIFLAFGDERKKVISGYPMGFQNFAGSIIPMNPEQSYYHAAWDAEYAGHIVDKVFLFYYDINCCARVRPSLPEGKSYKCEIIDAWNMTRVTACTGFKNGDELRMPGREYMAVLATLED